MLSEHREYFHTPEDNSHCSATNNFWGLFLTELNDSHMGVLQEHVDLDFSSESVLLSSSYAHRDEIESMGKLWTRLKVEYQTEFTEAIEWTYRFMRDLEPLQIAHHRDHVQLRRFADMLGQSESIAREYRHTQISISVDLTVNIPGDIREFEAAGIQCSETLQRLCTMEYGVPQLLETIEEVTGEFPLEEDEKPGEDAYRIFLYTRKNLELVAPYGNTPVEMYTSFIASDDMMNLPIWRIPEEMQGYQDFLQGNPDTSQSRKSYLNYQQHYAKSGESTVDALFYAYHHAAPDAYRHAIHHSIDLLRRRINQAHECERALAELGEVQAAWEELDGQVEQRISEIIAMQEEINGPKNRALDMLANALMNMVSPEDRKIMERLIMG